MHYINPWNIQAYLHSFSSSKSKQQQKSGDSESRKEQKQIDRLLKQYDKLSERGQKIFKERLLSREKSSKESEKIKEQKKSSFAKAEPTHQTLYSSQMSPESEYPSPTISLSYKKEESVNMGFEQLYLNKRTVPEGLPNLGNTCFLNSSLQLLYGVEAFKKILSDSMPFTLNNKFLQYLGILFKKMESRNFKDEKEKQSILKQLVLYIEKNNLGYLRSYQDQEDAIQIVTSIINVVDCDLQQNQQTKNLFMFTTLNQCRCLDQALTMESMIYNYDQQTDYCATCNEIITKKITTYPEYLLVFSKEDMELIYIHRQIYEFVSKIMYDKIGASSGHYICIRKENGIYYSFNDSVVKEVEKDHYKSSPYYKNRLLLYKKKQFIFKSCIL